MHEEILRQNYYCCLCCFCMNYTSAVDYQTRGLEVGGCSLPVSRHSLVGRWRKIMKNPDQIRGDLSRISTGYLSNTTLEAGVHKSQGTRSAGKLNCVHLIFVGTQCGICFMLPFWHLEFLGGF